MDKSVFYVCHMLLTCDKIFLVLTVRWCTQHMQGLAGRVWEITRWLKAVV